MKSWGGEGRGGQGPAPPHSLCGCPAQPDLGPTRARGPRGSSLPLAAGAPLPGPGVRGARGPQAQTAWPDGQGRRPGRGNAPSPGAGCPLPGQVQERTQALGLLPWAVVTAVPLPLPSSRVCTRNGDSAAPRERWPALVYSVPTPPRGARVCGQRGRHSPGRPGPGASEGAPPPGLCHGSPETGACGLLGSRAQGGLQQADPRTGS